MYKILLLIKDSVTRPLWTPYRVTETIDDIETTADFETDNLEVLEATILELLVTRPKNTVKAITDMDFVLDIIME